MISSIPFPTLQNLKHWHCSQLKIWFPDWEDYPQPPHQSLWERLRQPEVLTVCPSPHLTTGSGQPWLRAVMQRCYSRAVNTCISHNLAMSLSRIKFSCLKYNLREGERLHLLDFMGREPQLGYSRHLGSSSQGNAYYWLTSINFYYCSHYPPSKLSISHTPWYL